MKKLFITFISLILFVSITNCQCNFNRVYGTYVGMSNGGWSAIQTYDGCFVAVGYSKITASTDGTFIVKVNACGDTLWQKVYDFIQYPIVNIFISPDTSCH